MKQWCQFNVWSKETGGIDLCRRPAEKVFLHPERTTEWFCDAHYDDMIRRMKEARDYAAQHTDFETYKKMNDMLRLNNAL